MHVSSIGCRIGNVLRRFMAKFRDETTKRETMAWAKKLWETFKVFDALRDTYGYIDDLMTAAYAPDNVFVREALVGAYECGFEDFCLQTNRDLQEFAKGLGIKVVEDLHRTMGIKAKQNYNDELSRHSCWNVARQFNVVEAAGRTQVTVTEDDRRIGVKNKLPLGAYEPKAKEFSLGEDMYKEFLKKQDRK